MGIKGRLLLATFTSPLNHNGVSMAVARMEHEMRVRGWEVLVATCEPENTSIKTPDNYFNVPGDFKKKKQKTDDAIEIQLIEWLNLVRANVIVIHSWVGWPFTVLMPYAKKNSIPIFVMGHGFGAHMMQWTKIPPFFGLGRWLRSWLYVIKMVRSMPGMAGLVVLGKKPHFVRAFDYWLAVNTGFDRVHTIPNAVLPLDSNDLNFRERHALNGKLIYLCLAGYSPRKDQLLLLKAFQNAAVSNAVLVFIGPEKNGYSIKLFEESRSIAESTLVLYGLSRIEVEAAIKTCDVAILGSKSEMQPIFLLEAMSEGKPWICPKVGSVDELNGGIICNRSVSGISDAIKKTQDPELRRVLGEQGKEQWFHDFQTEKVYDSWDRLLIDCL